MRTISSPAPSAPRFAARPKTAMPAAQWHLTAPDSFAPHFGILNRHRSPEERQAKIIEDYLKKHELYQEPYIATRAEGGFKLVPSELPAEHLVALHNQLIDKKLKGLPESEFKRREIPLEPPEGEEGAPVEGPAQTDPEETQSGPRRIGRRAAIAGGVAFLAAQASPAVREQEAAAANAVVQQVVPTEVIETINAIKATLDNVESISNAIKKVSDDIKQFVTVELWDFVRGLPEKLLNSAMEAVKSIPGFGGILNA